MVGLEDFRRVASGDHYLCIVATTRTDGSVHASLVNAGVLAHPRTGEPVVAFVARGDARKLTLLRARPRAAVVARSGWEWVAVEGPVELVGPDDAEDAAPDGVEHADADADAGSASGASARRRRLLRDVFFAAGGTHDDWDAYDAVMEAERRVAVLVRPDRVSSNG